MSEIVSNTPCPKCIATGNVSFLKNRQGRFETYCDQNHAWADSTELQAAVAMARAQFPGAYQRQGPAPAAAPTVFQTVTIDPDSKKGIEQLLKSTITSGGDLKGAIFAVVDELNNLRKENANLKTVQKAVPGYVSPGGQAPPGSVIVAIPEFAIEAVAQSAAHEGKTIQNWVGEQMHSFFESYFSYAGR